MKKYLVVGLVGKVPTLNGVITSTVMKGNYFTVVRRWRSTHLHQRLLKVLKVR